MANGIALPARIRPPDTSPAVLPQRLPPAVTAPPPLPPSGQDRRLALGLLGGGLTLLLAYLVWRGRPQTADESLDTLPGWTPLGGSARHYLDPQGVERPYRAYLQAKAQAAGFDPEDLSRLDEQAWAISAWRNLRREVLAQGGIAPDPDFSPAAWPDHLVRARGMEPDLLAQELGFPDSRELNRHADKLYWDYLRIKDWQPGEAADRVSSDLEPWHLVDESLDRVPNPALRQVAERYLASRSLPGLQDHPLQRLSPEEGRALADAYDAVADEPSDPAAAASYRAFNEEVADQWQALIQAGVQMEPWQKPGQPYQSSQEMRQDLANNHHLWYFPTKAGSPIHGLMSESDNDRFRAVHDVFGHAMAGNQFGPVGEVNAFLDHSQMFSPQAQRAMATETLAQNAWFNFGRANQGKPLQAREFARQKAALLDPAFYQPLLERRDQESAVSRNIRENYHACPSHRHALRSATRVDDWRGPFEPGWLLPDGTMVPLGATFHDLYAAERLGQEWAKERTGMSADEFAIWRKGWVRYRRDGIAARRITAAQKAVLEPMLGDSVRFYADEHHPVHADIYFARPTGQLRVDRSLRLDEHNYRAVLNALASPNPQAALAHIRDGRSHDDVEPEVASSYTCSGGCSRDENSQDGAFYARETRVRRSLGPGRHYSSEQEAEDEAARILRRVGSSIRKPKVKFTGKANESSMFEEEGRPVIELGRMGGPPDQLTLAHEAAHAITRKQTKTFAHPHGHTGHGPQFERRFQAVLRRELPQQARALFPARAAA